MLDLVDFVRRVHWGQFVHPTLKGSLLSVLEFQRGASYPFTYRVYKTTPLELFDL